MLIDRHNTVHTLLLSAFDAQGGTDHFLKCFESVIEFYLENFASKAAEREKQKATASSEKVQDTAKSPITSLDPMEVDQISPKPFDDDLATVETTLVW